MKLSPALEQKLMSMPGAVVRPAGSFGLPPLDLPPGCSEKQFQDWIVGMAKANGWLVAHFRGVRVQRKDGATRWQTPVDVDGAGFPDLILLHVARKAMMALEAKVKPNTPTAAQEAWIAAFAAIPSCTAAVVYPSDWEWVQGHLAGRLGQ